MATERRRWPRRLVLVATGLIAVVLVGYLALIVLFRALVDPVSLADRAEPHISAALNRRVSIGSADVRIFPRPEVRLLRLRIENLPDFEGVPLATVDELGLRPRLLPLLRRRLDVDRVQLVGPRVLLQVDDQGRTNFGDFIPASRDDPEPVDSPLSLEIRSIELTDARVGYRDAVSGRTLQADGLWIEGSVARDGEGRLELDLESGLDSLRFAYPPAWRNGARGLRVRTEIEAVAGPRMGWIEIASGKASVNGLAVEVSGRADSLRSPTRLLDLVIRGEEVDLSRLISSLPDSIREAVPVDVWGELGVDLTVRGPLGPGAFPAVDGFVTVREAGLRRGADQALVESVDADVRITDDRAELSGAGGRIAGGQVSAGGVLALDSTLAFEGTLEGSADAGTLARAVAPADGDLPTASAGTVRWDVRAEGTMARPAATRLSGELGMEEMEITGGTLVRPVAIPTAVVRLVGTRALWEDVTVLAAGDPLRSSGSVSDLLGRLAVEPRSPVVDATVNGSRLDLDALVGPAEGEIGYGRIAWARLADRLLQGRAPEEWATERNLSRPGSLPVAGRVAFQLDSLLRAPYRLDRVRGTLSLAPDRLALEDVRFGAYGGTGTARGTMRLGDVDAEPFRLDVSLQGVRAEQYLAQNTPLGTLVSGSLSMDLSLEGGLDRLALPITQVLAGTGRFEILDGRIEPNPLTQGLLTFLRLGQVERLRFSRWSAPLVIDRGLILLDGSSFSGSELVAELSGALGFGGSVDLGALVRPDSTMALAATAAAGAAGDLIDRYVRAGGALELALRLTGTTSNPRFELDPEAMERSTRSVVEEAASRARESGEAEVRQRGLEALRGLVGQRATPSDTAAAVPAPVPADTTGGR